MPGWYGWNRSAYLYKAEEIGYNGAISAIAFEIASASSGTTAKIKIYLAENSATTMPALSATKKLQRHIGIIVQITHLPMMLLFLQVQQEMKV
jgi:phosphomannomutase